MSKKEIKWTAERRARLAEMYDAGATYPAIAEEFCLSETSVHAIVSRYHPNRVLRSRGSQIVLVTPEMIEQMLALYGDGLFLKDIADKLFVSITTIEARLRHHRQENPEAARALKSARTKALAEKGLGSTGRINNWKKHLGYTPVLAAAYTPLDAAMDVLRKFAPCSRDPQTGLIKYGSSRKTEEEIMALADRKRRQAEAWKVGAL